MYYSIIIYRLKFIEEYKAAIITFLISGTLILGMFSIHLTNHKDFITENYYEITPEPIVSQKEEQIDDALQGPSTDKAFNEDEEFKNVMRNFKSISSNDFEQTTQALEETKVRSLGENIITNESFNSIKTYALNSGEKESYEKLQEKLNKRLENKKIADEHSKAKSTLTYSLKGRALQYYETPRYLCEEGGKIVVSIRVDNNGTVFETFINGASNSSNACLIDYAISYAQSALFDISEKKDQLGTITFLFKGKN